MIKMKNSSTEKNQSHHMNQKNHSLDNVPELRFPEFVDDGEWVEKRLIETADKSIKWSFTGGPFGSNLKASDYTTDGIRIIQLQNIGDGEFHDDNKIFTSIEKADELLSCNIYSGDLIISKMGDPVGRACFIPDDLKRCVMASDGIRLVVDEKKNSKYFVYSLLNSKQIREAVEKKSTGSTRKRIGLDTLKEVELPIPSSILEQQKIASCLSSLDELISAHSQKLELLKDHKKGLMQNLFPQEGETVPKYRFPEFENDGEWVEEPLSSKVSVIDGDRGLSYPKAHEYSSDGYCVFLSAKNVTKNGFLFNEIQFITKEKDELLRKGKLSRFDIVMTTRGSLGQLAFYNENIQFENIRINSGMVILRPKDNRINPNYLYSYFNSNSIQSAIKSQGFGNAVQQLTVAVINNFTLRYPYTTQEQQKIASCLSAVDELIIAQEEKIEQLRLHKKGLMQGLFPKAV